MFRTWVERYRYTAHAIDSDEPEKLFLVWLLKKYNADIDRINDGRPAKTYCRHQHKGGHGLTVRGSWCRFEAIRDGYCGSHYERTPEELAERERRRQEYRDEFDRFDREDREWRAKCEADIRVALNEVAWRLEAIKLNEDFYSDSLDRDLRGMADEIERLRRELYEPSSTARQAGHFIAEHIAGRDVDLDKEAS